MESLEKGGAEIPGAEAEKAFEKDLEGVLGLVFEGGEGMEQYVRERHPELAAKDRTEELKQAAEREQENLVEALKVDPRFGRREEYLQTLSAKLLGVPSGEERLAFLRGFANFRQNHIAQKEVRRKMETADEGKSVSFGSADDLIVEGLLYRGIMDASVMQNIGMKADFSFSEWYEKTSGRRVFVDLLADYERMINEGKGYEGSPLDKTMLADELRKAGFSVLREGEGRFTLAYRAEGEKRKMEK